MAHELKDEEDAKSTYSDSSDEEIDQDFPIILLLTSGLWMIVFSVFAFGFDMDPDSCMADNKKDLLPYRIPFVDAEIEKATGDSDSPSSTSTNPQSESAIDVADRFRFFFQANFLLCSGQFAIGVVVLFVRHKENWFKSLLILIFKLSGLVILVLWLYAFVVRYMHSGCECSGDFIVNKTKAKNLLYIEGMFIKFSSLLVFFIVFLYVIGHVLNCYQRCLGGNQYAIGFEI